MVYDDLSQYEKALADYDRAIELDSTDSAIYLFRGVVFRKLNDHTNAILDYNSAIALDPRDAEAYHQRGIVHQLREQYHDAIADFTKVIEFDPSFEDAYFNRGHAYGSIGEIEKARSDLQMARQLKNKVSKNDSNLVTNNSSQMNGERNSFGDNSSFIEQPTTFMGIQDHGQRIGYVIDRSFSMDNDSALQSAIIELLRSISQLDASQHFQIIFYSNSFEVLSPTGQDSDFFEGTDSQRNLVIRRLRSISAKGGTHHLPAINKALEGNPDVIYLLTDGAAETALAGYELNQIKKRNRSGTHIHCIEFGRTAKPVLDGERNFLKKLSEQNQGQYVYHNIRSK